MRTTPITVTEAVRHFSEYVHRAAFGHERFLLKRGRCTLAELRPVHPPGITLGTLPELLDNLPHLGKDEAAAFAADLKATAKRTRSERLRDPWASSSTPTS